MLPQSTLISTLLLISLSITHVHGDCRKTFTYHPKYNYGYEITCTRTSSVELSTTMANNAISLSIANSNITFDSKTLKYLKKIRLLNITDTQISFNSTNDEAITLSTTHNKSGKPTKTKNAFSSLTNLETLIIQNCNLTSEGILYINDLENLATLKLDNDSIENFPTDALKQLKNLQTLSLNHNRIQHIGNLSICSLNNLRQLHLGDNLIRELMNDDIMCLNQLQILNLSGNALTKLHGISSKSLNILSVDSNQIDCIERIDAPNLSTLDMSANKLTNVSVNDFKGLNSLLKLDLSRNNLTSVLLTNKFLSYVDLSHNKLTSIPKFDLGYLKTFNLSYNNISEINPEDLLRLTNLEHFDLSDNNVKIVYSQSFLKMLNISAINLSGNSLKNLSLDFDKESKLAVFNVSHNNIDSMSDKWFINLTNLKHLDVSFNKLKSLNDSTFKNLEHLETLNLSHNFLTQLDYKLLEPLENLIILDVDSNMIQEIDYGSIVSELPNLDAFKAKNNLLTCEFLTKMIHYFKDNDITFSLNEHLDFDKENVEGIYCKETRNKLLDLKKTEEALANNTKMLNELFALYNHDTGGMTVSGSAFDGAHSYSLSGGEIVASVLSLISLVIVVTLAVQKAIVWHRRRNYLADELELITHEPYKRLG